MVAQNINNMREEMIDSANERQLGDITSIIEPQKFIEKHYQSQMQTSESQRQEAAGEHNNLGNNNQNAQNGQSVAEPPKFLFEEVLKKPPSPKQADTRLQQIEELREEAKQIGEQISAVQHQLAAQEAVQGQKPSQNQVSKQEIPDQMNQAEDVKDPSVLDGKNLEQQQPNQEQAETEKENVKKDELGNQNSSGQNELLPSPLLSQTQDGQEYQTTNKLVDFWADDGEDQPRDVRPYEELIQEEEASPKPKFYAQELLGQSARGSDKEAHGQASQEYLLPAYPEGQHPQSFVMDAEEQVSRDSKPAAKVVTKPYSGPRVLKMADYFQGADVADEQRVGVYDNVTPVTEPAIVGTDYSLPQLDRPQLSASTITGQQKTKFDEQTEVERLEKQLLDNVDVNFLFSKGANLFSGLIDANRVQQIVQKIKLLVKDKVRQGCKDVDYAQLVEYLQAKDQGLVQPDEPTNEKDEETKWQDTVQFMRSNPKLLMQMIPGYDDDNNTNQKVISSNGSTVQQAEVILQGSRVYDKIQEAKKWQQLQVLSSKFQQQRSTQSKRPALSQFLKNPVPRPQSGTRFASAATSMIRSQTGEIPQKLISISSTNSKAPIHKSNITATNLSLNKYPSENRARQTGNTSMNSQSSVGRPKLAPVKPTMRIADYINEVAAKGPPPYSRPESVHSTKNSQPMKQNFLAISSEPTSNQPKFASNQQKVNKGKENIQVGVAGLMVGGSIKSPTETKTSQRKSKPKQQVSNREDKKKTRNKQMPEEYNQNQIKKVDDNDFVTFNQAKSKEQEEDATDQKQQVQLLPQSKHANAQDLRKPKNTATYGEGTQGSDTNMELLVHSNDVTIQDGSMSLPEILHTSQQDKPNFSIKIDNNSFDILNPNAEQIKSGGTREGEGADERAQDQRSVLIQNRQTLSQAKTRISYIKPNIEKSSQASSRLHGSRSGSNRQYRLQRDASVSKGQNDSNVQSSQPLAKFMDPNHYFMRQRSKNEVDPNQEQSFNRQVGSDWATHGKGQMDEQQRTFQKPRNVVRFGKAQRPITAQVDTTNHPDQIVGIRRDKQFQGRTAVNASMNMSNINLENSKNDIFSQNSLFYQQKDDALQLVNQKSISNVHSNVNIMDNQNRQSGQIKDKGGHSNQVLAPLPPKFVKVRSFGSRRHQTLSKGSGMYENFSFVKSAKTTFYKPVNFNPLKKLNSDMNIVNDVELSNPKINTSPKNRSRKRSSPSLSKSRSRSPGLKKKNKYSHDVGAGGNALNVQNKAAQRSDKSVDARPSDVLYASERPVGSASILKSNKSPPRYRQSKYSITDVDGCSNIAMSGRNNMMCQTDIRGVEHRILIRPDKFDSDPFEDKSDLDQNLERIIQDEALSVGQNGSTIGSQNRRSQSGSYKVPNINWSETPVHDYYLANRENPHILKGSVEMYSEGEIDYVLDMIKNAYQDFKRTDIMKPFFLKAMETLKFLLKEQTIEPVYQRVYQEYGEITLENTMKLLIRCKLSFNSRNMLMKMFQVLDEYKLAADTIKQTIDYQQSYKVDRKTFEQLQILANEILDKAKKVFKQADAMYGSSHRQFRNKSFTFHNKAITNQLRAEIGQIRSCLRAFRIKKEGKGPHMKERIWMGEGDKPQVNELEDESDSDVEKHSDGQ